MRLGISLRRGIGEAVILVHGLTDSAACWGQVVDALCGYYDLIAYDLRAHGLSDAPETGYSIDDHAADLSSLIDDLRLNSATLVGHSLGAEIALQVALARPDVVASLVIEEPPWHPDWVGDPNDRRMMAAKNWREWIEHLQSKSLEEVIQFGHEATPNWSDEDIYTWAMSKHQLRLNGLKSVLAHRPSWQSVVSEIHCPTLLVIGDSRRGGLVPLAVALEAQNQSKWLKFVRFEGVGHSVHRDQFQTYVATIKEFLRNGISQVPQQS
jgi:pimeloyl-ACP methyl ester carboxylesterase